MQEYFLNFWGENSAMMEKVVANIAALRDFCKRERHSGVLHRPAEEQSDEDRALLNDMSRAGSDPLAGAAAGDCRAGAG